MVALPTSLDLTPSAGADLPAISVSPTDFGLGQAADEMHQVGIMQKRTDALEIRAQALRDKQSVAPMVAQVQAGNAADLATAVASGKAGTPGFVGDLYDAAAQRAERAATTNGLSPGQASELRDAAMAHATQIAVAAGNAHAQALAEPIAEATKAQQTNDIGLGLSAYQGSFLPAFNTAKNGYLPGGDAPTFVGQVAAAHDAAASAALAAAPEPVRPILATQLAAERVRNLQPEPVDEQ